MSNVSQWSTTDASNNSAAPNGAPEDMAPSSVNDVQRATMGAVRRWLQELAGDLTTAGTGNAYTVTTTNAHAALADVPLIAVEANRANTGATTLQIDSLTATAVTLTDGTALIGGEIENGGVYLFVYDGTNFQLLNPSARAVVKATSTDDVDLAGISGALLVGGDGTAAHAAHDANEIQAKAGPTTVANLSLNPHGGAILVGEAAANGNTNQLRNQNTLVAGNQASPLTIQNDQDGAPALGAVQNIYLAIERSDGVDIGLVGFASDAELLLLSRNHGGGIRLQGEDAGGVLRDLLAADPDGDVTIYRAGTIIFQTKAGGVSVFGSDATVDNSSASTQTRVNARNSAGGVSIQAVAITAAMQIRQTNAGGTSEDIWIQGVRNGAVTLYHNGLSRVSTTANGFSVTDGTRTLTFDGSANDVDQVHESGSFTVTWGNGFTTSPSSTARWQRIGKMVFVTLSGFTATSNATSFASNTNDIPASITPAADQLCDSTGAIDNSATTLIAPITVEVSATNRSITLHRVSTDGISRTHYLNTGASWTNSGTKGLDGEVHFQYRV